MTTVPSQATWADAMCWGPGAPSAPIRRWLARRRLTPPMPARPEHQPGHAVLRLNPRPESMGGISDEQRDLADGQPPARIVQERGTAVACPAALRDPVRMQCRRWHRQARGSRLADVADEERSEPPGDSAAPSGVAGAHGEPPPTANASHEARVPLEERRSWRFRSVTGLYVMFLLATIGVTVLFAHRHQWVGFGVFLLVVLCLAPMTAIRAAGYGGLSDVKLDGDSGKEFAPIPEEVRTSGWWRAILWVWLAWAIVLSAGAVVTGVRHLWLAFAGALFSAGVCWIKLAVARAGYNPPDLEP